MDGDVRYVNIRGNWTERAEREVADNLEWALGLGAQGATLTGRRAGGAQ
jgi:hypothetical protein